MALSKLTKVQTLGIGSNIEVVGVITTGQFKSGTSNLHSSGIELTNLNVSGIATIGGNVSIGGTLTYEDVTNIDSVGIITARSTIDAQGSINLADSIIHTGDTDTKIRFPAANTVTVEAGGHERLRIHQSKILKGLTSARGNYGNNTSGVEYGVQIEGTSAITAGLSIVRNSNDANDGGIVLGKTRATSTGGNTVVQAGDDLGNLTFAGNDGSTMLFGAEIFAEVQSGVGNDDMPADLIFKTNGGSTSTTERLRITSDGKLLVGVTSSDFKLHVDASNKAAEIGIDNSSTYKSALNTTNNVNADFNIQHKINSTSIGTGVNVPLCFHINGGFAADSAEKMRIDTNGNFIIGATGTGNASVYARNILISGSSNNGITIHTTDTSGSNRKCCLFFGTGTSVADMADGMLFYDHAGQYMHLSVNGAGTGVTKASIRLHSDGTVRFDSTPTTTNSISLLLKSHKARVVNDNNGILFKDASDHSQAAIYVQKKSTSNGSSDLVFSTSSGQVVASLQGIPERFRIDKDGKLHKGGYQIYPVIQIHQARISGSVSNSAVGSYQDIKNLVTFTPFKSGSMVHVQVICQTWNGSQSDGSADAYARLQHNNGGSYSTFTECDRVQGNFAYDERYHHSPMIMDGWFTTTTTNSTTIKFQGNQAGSLPVAFNWFHAYGGRITLMEYDVT